MPLLPFERFSKTKFSGGHGELVPKGFRGDLFVAKLNPSGSALVFSTYLGGTGDEGLGALRVDGTRNVYVAGTTTSPDFPMTTGAFQTHW